MAIIAVLGCVFCLARAASWPNNHGYKSSEAWLPREPVITAKTGEDLVPDSSSLPKHWDWRNVDGRSFVTADVNQHLPYYCGSCWIHGTVAALNDRIKLLRNASFPDVMLARQALVNCVPQPNGSYPAPGCNGGDSYMILKYMHHHAIPDETCSPYLARNDICDPDAMCQNAAAPFMVDAGWSPSEHFSIPGYLKYTVGDHGVIKGEAAMMKEIYARGPISCNIACDGNFLLNYSNVAAKNEGVFVTSATYNETDHIIEVTGWGETRSGLKYWVIRNSWGTYWGDKGWFKLPRGVNQNLIESECTWAVPQYADLDAAMSGQVLGDFVRGLKKVEGLLPQEDFILPHASVGLAAIPSNDSAFALVAALSAAVGACGVLLVQKVMKTRSRVSTKAPLLETTWH
eukprot:TRINITY_DN14446_c0_g1_i1.p1 TRINITY_DN14446_c0_g1~~TRINITY_DN14446_c0_g1_i1.p1  ORF type:complete len:401 (+),score=44.84 TRINITY_DN14446_c0_g1_i1:30-1232(+)